MALNDMFPYTWKQHKIPPIFIMVNAHPKLLSHKNRYLATEIPPRRNPTDRKYGNLDNRTVIAVKYGL